MKRVLLAGLYHETNTFVAEPTGFDEFSILRGPDLPACAGDGSPRQMFQVPGCQRPVSGLAQPPPCIGARTVSQPKIRPRTIPNRLHRLVRRIRN